MKHTLVATMEDGPSVLNAWSRCSASAASPSIA